MNKTTPQLILMFCAVVFGLTACNKGLQRLADDSSSQKSPENTSRQVAVIEGNILLSKPVAGSAITSPVAVAGRVQNDITRVIVQVVGATNIVYGQQEVVVGDNGQFTASLEYQDPQTVQGVIRVFHVVGEGEQAVAEDVITNEVQFSDYTPPTIQLFFNNIEGDPELTNCSQVFSVERQIATNDPLLNATLAALLQGTNEQEANNGFVSQIPEPTVPVADIRQADEEGVLLFSFNPDFYALLTTECQQQGAVAQIRETMLQFDQITDVQFFVGDQQLTEL